MATTSYEGAEHKLVFSDEFEVPGRTFNDGHDPRWTAVNKNDYTNMALHFYRADAVTTSGGKLNITTEFKPTTFLSAEDTTGTVEMVKRTKGYSSGLIQGWNKFCFTGGIMEIKAKLPGKGHVGGLWPAMWLLGALARATYVGSTDWIWPWSYGKCDRSQQRKQEINACELNPHYKMHPYEGRGAPEIDLIEAMPGTGTMNYNLKKPYYSASLQVAPGRAENRPVEGKRPLKGQWYDKGLRYGANASVNAFFYGEVLKHKNKEETYVADAISANKAIEETHFEKDHTYRFEWSTTPGRESLRWFLDGEIVFEILPEALKFTGAKMPDEPMHVLLNTAVSSTWGFPAPCPLGCACSCYDCGDAKCDCGMPTGFCGNLPAHYEVESVRIYQNPDEPTHKVGCSTDAKPTKAFIAGHKRRYYDPYNGEKEPLQPQQTGGAKCHADADCGGDTLRGVCYSGKCACRAGHIGPKCLAHPGFDDIIYDHEASVGFSAPYVPSPLVRALAGAAALLAAVIALHISSRRNARKAVST
ncbi:beta-glucan synthesis-associated protein-domain-containing protein [Pelagophyceae sp. CCMP2097]|nr:beta-glucan synthesis-associated protein-domain-containing protein [Pelagophyceae sp. CCMP2097]